MEPEPRDRDATGEGPFPSDPPISATAPDDALAVSPRPEAGDDGTPIPSASDPLERICPYLRSADGAWRSAQPDDDHRCTSQQPPAHLPLLAQERFCLTSSHVRCEWFKIAEASRAQTLERDRVPSAQVHNARFRPAVRSVPVALAPASHGAEPGARLAARARLAGRGRAVRVGFGCALFRVSGASAVLLAGVGGGPAAPLTGASPSPTIDVSPAPPPAAVAATPLVPASTPTPAPRTASPEPTPLLVAYEVQPGERLRAIAEKFGVRRQQIVRANDLGVPPRVEPGDTIVIPLPPGSSAPPGSSPLPSAP
jgi:LysM repeat protein